MVTMSHWSTGWLAPIALVGAVSLVACGDDASDTTRTADVEAVGGEQHRQIQAAEAAERQAKFDAAAVTYGDTGFVNPWEAGNRAAQEALRGISSTG
jgi:hypothetical protein